MPGPQSCSSAAGLAASACLHHSAHVTRRPAPTRAAQTRALGDPAAPGRIRRFVSTSRSCGSSASSSRARRRTRPHRGCAILAWRCRETKWTSPSEWLMPTTAAMSMACSPSSRPPTSSGTPGIVSGSRWGRRTADARASSGSPPTPAKTGRSSRSSLRSFAISAIGCSMLGRMKGRGKASGVPVDQPFVTIVDFRGDRIWRSQVYLDHAEGLRAAGLSE